MIKCLDRCLDSSSIVASVLIDVQSWKMNHPKMFETRPTDTRRSTRQLNLVSKTVTISMLISGEEAPKAKRDCKENFGKIKRFQSFEHCSKFGDDHEEEFYCPDKGNLTRLCTEHCQLDGLSCKTEVDIDACTCAGKMLKFHEIAIYDMKT